MPVVRSRVSQTGKLSDFATATSRALGAVQSTLGVGGCGNIFFGHVLVAVRQGKRRDTVSTGEGDWEDVQRRRLNMSRFICTLVS
jgi:hypothetical protein